MAVSPNGTYVAGLAGNMFNATGFDPDVEIRRMSDGQLVSRIHFRRALTFDTEMWWENDSAVLFPVMGRRANYLVRCHLSGGCRLAAHPLSTGDFSHNNQADWHDSSN
jgi:hypothetical protein